MATLRQNLETYRTNIGAELAALDVSKMSYNVDGQNETYDEHRNSLIESLRQVNELLASGAGDNMDQPFEVEGLGRT